jgi:hypothetical protein
MHDQSQSSSGFDFNDLNQLSIKIDKYSQRIIKMFEFILFLYEVLCAPN